MSAGHLLTYIQHDPVVASLFNREIYLVDIPLTHLSSASFCRGDIHHLTSAFSLLLDECKSADVTGVEVRLAIVVPQNTVALA